MKQFDEPRYKSKALTCPRISLSLSVQKCWGFVCWGGLWLNLASDWTRGRLRRGHRSIPGDRGWVPVCWGRISNLNLGTARWTGTRNGQNLRQCNYSGSPCTRRQRRHSEMPDAYISGLLLIVPWRFDESKLCSVKLVLYVAYNLPADI